MLSVIVPVYNAEKYLEKCIESICQQTYRDLDIILIDDGSQDQSGAICDQFKAIDGRIRVFHKENGIRICLNDLWRKLVRRIWLLVDILL